MDRDGESVARIMFISVGFLATLATGILLLVLLDDVATASGKIESCYTSDWSGGDRLKIGVAMYGYRSFRVDAYMGTFQTLDDAADAAKRHGCPMFPGDTAKVLKAEAP